MAKKKKVAKTVKKTVKTKATAVNLEDQQLAEEAIAARERRHE